MEAFDPLVIAWCAFALFCGGLIKGTLGVGTPLLTVPLMALVLPVQMAVILMAVPVVVANVWQAFKAGRLHAAAVRFWPSFAAILVGTYGGVAILSKIDEGALLLVVGVVVIASAILQGSSYRLNLKPALEKPGGVFFGLASGIVGGLSSMFGPMLIIYLVSIPGLDKERFVATISFLYIACVVPWALMLLWFGILDRQLVVLSALATVPVVGGLVVGEVLRQRVSDDRFQKMVLIVLLLSGGAMLWRAVV
ncbi:MAG: sulfite exporter TauE/SafE family protein [Arenicellales bacterium]|nr:sulfite exporter TauE/SafE family protein [Arenicellales bacterium]